MLMLLYCSAIFADPKVTAEISPSDAVDENFQTHLLCVHVPGIWVHSLTIHKSSGLDMWGWFPFIEESAKKHESSCVA